MAPALANPGEKDDKELNDPGTEKGMLGRDIASSIPHISTSATSVIVPLASGTAEVVVRGIPEHQRKNIHNQKPRRARGGVFAIIIGIYQ